jgi:hypothetical protein
MTEEEESYTQTSPWMRGAWMLILVILLRIAEIVLFVCAVLQFGWLLFAKNRNANIARFGEKLGNWMAMTARFLSGASEEKPFPWSEWK